MALAVACFMIAGESVPSAAQYHRSPDPDPGWGGSGACAACLRGCLNAYEAARNLCGSNLTCTRLAQAELRACQGNCYTDYNDC